METNGRGVRLEWLVAAFALLLLGASLMAALLPRRQVIKDIVPQDVVVNQEQSAPSADQQRMNPADRALTQEIRKAIHHDRRLSVYGRNIKIFTQYGKITLRGPVRSLEEKVNLGAMAVAAGGEENVTNQLDVDLLR